MAEWQTQTTQNRSGNHVGSTPTTGIKKRTSPACLGEFSFLSAACERVEQHGPALQGERSALRAVAQCAGDPHHRHCKQLEIERFWAVFLFLLSFLYFGVFWEDIDDCIRRGHLTGEIQMCINVACCADVTVTEPLLNLLQAHAIGIEQTGTTMAQVVETDTLHLVCDQKIREMLTQKVGPNPLSHRVYIDIVKIIAAIAFAADLPILLLLLFHFIEHLLTGRD